MQCHVIISSRLKCLYLQQPKRGCAQQTMLDPDELEAEMSWGGGFRAPEKPSAAAKPKKRLQFSDYANNNNQDDDYDAPIQRKSSSLLIEDDDDDERPMIRKKTVATSSETINKSLGPVPYRVQEAASLIISSGRLPKQIQKEITSFLLQKPHEFISVDPLILVCASVDTGTVRIYCKEVINVSLHLMALALGATFSLQVTPKARTQEEPWGEAVTARPCRSAQVSERVQPVGTLKAVQKALAKIQSAPPDLDLQVDYYMQQLGTLDSATACDPDWWKDHVDALRLICMGQGKPIEKERGIRGKLAKME